MLIDFCHRSNARWKIRRFSRHAKHDTLLKYDDNQRDEVGQWRRCWERIRSEPGDRIVAAPTALGFLGVSPHRFGGVWKSRSLA
jgi:hypothetical protein